MRKRTLTALTASLFLLYAPAQAELTSDTLSAYNAAVTANDGDAILATGKRLLSEAISDPDNPNATVAAYEAALKLCERDACAAAQPGANFVLSQPDTGGHPVMTDRALLKAFADYKVESDAQTRADLEAALMAAKPTEPSYLSLRAFMQLADEYYVGRDWAKAQDIAAAAVEHLAIVKSNVPDIYYLAREIEAISGFIHRRGVESHEALIRLEEDLGQSLADTSAEGKEIPEWMEDMYWRSTAWTYAARGVFTTYDKKGSLGNFRATELKERGLTDAEIRAIRGEYPRRTSWRKRDRDIPNADLPQCAGELVDRPDIRFPIQAGMRGLMGSVIIRMQFDENGNVIDPEVLAAVPVDGFEEDVIRSVSKWRWKKSSDETRECRMNRDELVMAVSFSLG